MCRPHPPTINNQKENYINTHNHWIYNGQPYDRDKEQHQDHFGFVYVITSKKSGRKYIGSKFFSHRRTRPPLKGKKRKRITQIDSGWSDYTGSSQELNDDIHFWGRELFVFEITHVLLSKKQLRYTEVQQQFKHDVLYSQMDDGTYLYLNNNINGKWFR